MANKPKVRKNTRAINSMLKRLEGEQVHQVLMYPNKCEHKVFSVNSIIEKTNGSGYIYQNDDFEDEFLYTDCDLNFLDLEAVYFQTDCDILVISSFSEEKLKLKLKEMSDNILRILGDK